MTHAALKDLVKKWRHDAMQSRHDPGAFLDKFIEGYVETLEECADQLSAALSAYTTPSPGPQGGGEFEAWFARQDCRLDWKEIVRLAYLATPPAHQPGEVEQAAMRIAVISGDGPISDSDEHWWIHLGDDRRAKYIEMATAALAPKEAG